MPLDSLEDCRKRNIFLRTALDKAKRDLGNSL
jgi:hypothetical protein